MVSTLAQTEELHELLISQILWFLEPRSQLEKESMA